MALGKGSISQQCIGAPHSWLGVLHLFFTGTSYLNAKLLFGIQQRQQGTCSLPGPGTRPSGSGSHTKSWSGGDGSAASCMMCWGMKNSSQHMAAAAPRLRPVSMYDGGGVCRVANSRRHMAAAVPSQRPESDVLPALRDTPHSSSIIAHGPQPWCWLLSGTHPTTPMNTDAHTDIVAKRSKAL